MQVYNYIAWQLLKNRIILMALYVETLFQASPLLSTCKSNVFWRFKYHTGKNTDRSSNGVIMASKEIERKPCCRKRVVFVSVGHPTFSMQPEMQTHLRPAEYFALWWSQSLFLIPETNVYSWSSQEFPFTTSTSGANPLSTSTFLLVSTPNLSYFGSCKSLTCF